MTPIKPQKLHQPRAQSPSSQSQKHGSYEFAERGGIYRIQPIVGAVAQVVIVQGAAGQRYTLGRLVVG